MHDATLTALFRRFRERSDGAALAAIFDATARELLDVAHHLVRDPAEAEDLVQLTFLAAIRRAERYDGSAPLRAWLYGILWREAAKARRGAARRAGVEISAAPEPIDHDGPPDQLARREVPEAVANALGRLPARYREVLEPLLGAELRIEEIAARLGRSPGTVRSQIHRGLERLRRGLPAGLAPASGVALVPLRGLEAVRGEILRAAGSPPIHVAAAQAAALQAALGGLLVSKTTLVAACIGLVAVAGAWFAAAGARSSGDGRPAGLAIAPLASADAASPATAENRPADAGPLDQGADVDRSTVAAAAPAPASQDAVDYWLARFAEAPNDWSHGGAVAARIAELPADEALRIMRAVWPRLSVPVKEQALKPFVFDGGHAHALKLLDLAATDPSVSVQSRAFAYLEAYAFRDFATDYEGYLRWAEQYRDMPIGDALRANAQGFVGELLSLPPAAFAERVRALERLDLDAGGPAGLDLPAEMRAAGGLRVLDACLADADPELRALGLRWSKTLQADETWLRRWVMPSIERPDETPPEVLGASFDALARPDCAWAREPILAYLGRAADAEPREPGQPGEPGARQPGASDAAGALAEIGDPAAIPVMIELIRRDRSGTFAYDVGYFGLAKLAGVDWQESYDADWWLDWWVKNQRRFSIAPADSAAEKK